MSDPIISVSGLRGILGEQLTPLVATRYIAALASTLPRGQVVVGRDGRASGKMLSQAVSATLAAHGLETVDLDVAATPTVGIQVLQQHAVAGVQISASHNPREYNGLKLFGSDGRVLTKVAGEKILAAYHAGQSRWVTSDLIATNRQISDPHSVHADRVLETVDTKKIQSRKFRVLLDCNHGAGGLLGKQLLERLDCRFSLVGDVADGNFEHPPEPLAENLSGISEMVRGGGFDVGFCQDPDADRLAVIDENGAYIGEELTLALCLLQALPGKQGKVVTNCATSGLSRWIAEKHGCQLVQSAVGEANVADMMIAEKAIFGGEGNGGPIDPLVGYVRDSFVGMARILDLLASSGQSISQLVASLPKLSIVKDKIALPATALPQFFEHLTREMPDATVSRQDGLKLEWNDTWLLVRGSNTEPIVRLIAEAADISAAQALCDRARTVSLQLKKV